MQNFQQKQHCVTIAEGFDLSKRDIFDDEARLYSSNIETKDQRFFEESRPKKGRLDNSNVKVVPFHFFEYDNKKKKQITDNKERYQAGYQYEMGMSR